MIEHEDSVLSEEKNWLSNGCRKRQVDQGEKVEKHILYEVLTGLLFADAALKSTIC